MRRVRATPETRRSENLTERQKCESILKVECKGFAESNNPRQQCDAAVYYDSLDCHANARNDGEKAFTLAEVLITLVVIGVIAAITVPMIHTNYKKQETVSKLKKVYSSLSQVLRRSQQENGPLFEYNKNNKQGKDIYNIYFKPYLRNSKLVENWKKAGYKQSNPFISPSGTQETMNIGDEYFGRVTFELDESTYVMIIAKTDKMPEVIVDINKSNKPNQFGKDVFYMMIDEHKGLIPYCEGKNKTSLSWINGDCKTYGYCCIDKIMHAGWEIKDDYPW